MGNIQGAKDTFYQMLRDRVAAGNPARTMVVRGVLRPAVLTMENELPGTAPEALPVAEAFCLRWTGIALDAQSAEPLLQLGCEIRYASDGSDGAAGMDRGRALTAMDAELLMALTATPMNTAAVTFAESAGGGASTASTPGGNIFWGMPVPGPVVEKGERMERVVNVEVFCDGQ